jgi:hypothetical protein
MSSAYHPQSDGQTERDNQCIENFLRCFIQAAPNSGLSGYIWLNTGTTSVITQPYSIHHLRFCMAIIQPILA